MQVFWVRIPCLVYGTYSSNVRREVRAGLGPSQNLEISYLKDTFLLFQIMVSKNRARESACVRTCIHRCTLGSNDNFVAYEYFT